MPFARRIFSGLLACGCLMVPSRLAAQFTWSSGDLSTVGIPGNTLTSGQTLSIDTGANHDLAAQTLTNNGGTITWNAGYIRGGSDPGSSIVNLSGGTFSDANADGYSMSNPFGGSFFFDNQGSYIRNIAGSPTLFDIPFLNGGSVNLQQGSIQFRAGGTMTSTGTMTAASGTTIQFTNGYTVQSGASLAGAGTFQHSGGTLTLGGTVNVGNFLQTGGTLAGDQTFGSGTFTWNAGDWNGSGNTTTIGAGATLNIATGSNHDFANRTITNLGTVNWTAGYIRGGSAPGSAFTNAVGATFNDLNGSSYVVQNPFGGTFTFTNAGSYIRNAAGITYFDVPFDNSGSVNLQQGSIQFRAGGTMTSTGTMAAALGTTIQFTNGYNILNGASLGGAGTYQLSGGTMTLTGTVNVGNFLQTGGTLAGDQTFGSGTFTWNAGTWNGSANTTTLGAAAVLNIATGTNHDFSGRTITNNGTVNWTAGYIRGGSDPGSAFINAAGATFNDLNASSYIVQNPFGGTFTFTNNGSYVRNATGITYFDVPFVNNSTVDLQQGALQFRAGGTLASTGSITAASGTTVTFTNGFSIQNGSSLAGAGTFALTGGTLTLDGSVAVGTFTQTGGVLAGAQTLASGTFNWNAGDWNTGAAATTIIGAGATLNINTGSNHDFANRTITNNGIVNWNTGYIRGGSSAGSAFVNAAGGTFNDLNASSYIVQNPFGGTFTFTNNGSYVRNATGTTFFDVPFVNNSTVALQQGALQFRGGGTLASTGSITAASGTTVTFTNGFSIQNGSSLAGAGTFALTGGTLTLDGSVAVATFTQTGGVLAGTQTLASGTFNWDAGDWNTGAAAATTIGAGATLNIATGSNHDFANRTVTNLGTVIWTSGYIRGGSSPGSSFLNAGGATFRDRNASGYIVQNPFGGTFGFTNDGTYIRENGGVSYVDIPFTNNGTLLLDDGELQLRGGTSFASTSELSYVLAGPTSGTDFGLLTISSALVLDGSLEISFAGGFENTATFGQTFTLLSSGGLSGSFLNVASGSRLVSSDGLGSFAVHYGSSSPFAANSVVLSGFVAVPEPSTWALLLLGGGVVALTLRRRRRGAA